MVNAHRSRHEVGQQVMPAGWLVALAFSCLVAWLLYGKSKRLTDALLVRHRPGCLAGLHYLDL